jgi:hypothetical protein
MAIIIATTMIEKGCAMVEDDHDDDAIVLQPIKGTEEAIMHYDS